jgi:hypothetical protein
MICTCLICSSIIIFDVQTKQLLAQSIRLLGNTKLLSLWKLSGGCTLPCLKSGAVPLTDCHLRGCLASFEASYAVDLGATCKFLRPPTACSKPTMNIWRFIAFCAGETRGPALPLITSFHIATLDHALRLGNEATVFRRHARLGLFGS